MYHSISDDPESGVHPYYRVCTSPKRFAEHMQWLKQAGYRGVTLREGLAWLNSPMDVQSPMLNVECSPISHSAFRVPRSADGPPSSPARSPVVSGLWSGDHPVAITFDDGFHDFYTAAWPVLQQHGFSATMYLPTAFIGGTRRVFRPRGSASISHSKSCLTWNEVRELHSVGIEFGSHTVNHPKLVELVWDRIEYELRTSISELQSRLGCAVTSFAYPYAFPQEDQAYVEQFAGLLAEAGYTNAVTTRIGCARALDSSFTLARLPANDLDDPLLFRAKLSGAYDWLGPMQHWKRRLQHCSRAPNSLSRVGGPRLPMDRQPSSNQPSSSSPC